MSVIEQKPASAAKLNSKTVNKKTNTGRYLAHIGLAVISLVGCGLTVLYKPDADISEIIAIGTGYVGLLMIAATLVIGPINLFRKRRNPVNIDFRRDVGIWAGINVLVHVFFSFQLFQRGQILQYFVGTDGAPRTDIFGLSNDVGLIALLVLLPLLITSNQISLKLLKGKRWKNLQRLTYGLIVTGVLHTAGFILYNARETVFSLGLIGVSLAVLVAQGVGVAVTLQRERQRALANATPVAQPMLIPAVEPTFAESQLARRQFIKFVGGTILAGVAMGTSAALVSHALAPSNGTANEVAANDPVTAIPPTNPPTSGSNGTTGSGNPFGSSGGNGSTNNGVPGTGSTGTNNGTGNFGGGRRGRDRQGFGSNQPPTNNGTSGNGSAPTNNGSTGNIAAPSNPTTPAANGGSSSSAGSSSSSSSKGNVLATVSSLAAGKAMAITTPSGNSAFLIHRTDGSVACYSGLCTHEPVPLVYEESQQVLYCPRHDVAFSTQNGAPSSPPARRALASYAVTVDGQGNIVYAQS